ncbi:MAG: hypothetical protein HY812_01510 [Planctomycetes bacterium]|nr:hypothetical protein [Planctomycetota bacterium]
MDQVAAVRIGKTRRLRRVAFPEEMPARGSMIVVRTERGTEIARLLGEQDLPQEAPAARAPQGEEGLAESAAGPDAPEETSFLRLASGADLQALAALCSEAEPQELAFFRDKVLELFLPMKPVAVEHLLGGEKILFYFTSQGRVDFRRLVRLLVAKYHTRIELRRISPRDAAALEGGLGICGRDVCCRQWLGELRPISIKMARAQNRPIASDANLGLCSRLRCCLRYELAGYEGQDRCGRCRGE